MTIDEILYNMELEIMENISRLISSGSISSAKWQVDKLAEIGLLNDRNKKVIRKYMKELDPAVSAEIEKQLTAHLNKVDGVLVTIGPVPAGADIRMAQLIMAASRNSAAIANQIGNNMLGASQQIYTNSIIQVSNEVLSGVSTTVQARTKVISEWSEKGIPALITKPNKRTGKSSEWQADAYVNMQIRTQVRATTTEITLTRSEQYGNDLIEVDSHVGARELCAPYQGRVFSLSGNSDKYKPLGSTSYGDPAGLFGINCGHNMYPFIEGLSKKTYKSDNSKKNADAYKESQRQRLLERRIRASKRQIETLKAGGLPTEQATKTLKNRQSTMRDFIGDSGRTRRYNREQI